MVNKNITTEVEKYLLTRGIKIDIPQIDVDITFLRDALEDLNDERMAKVAGAWDTNKEEILFVLSLISNNIVREMLFKCAPAETVIKRDSLLEIAKISKYFEYIVEQNASRVKQEADKLEKKNNEDKPKK